MTSTMATPGTGAALPSERERRAAALQELITAEDLDVLVLAANDYRGHKGTLRWVADFNLAHRYGYAIVGRGRAPELLLPVNLTMNPRGAWDVPVRYARHVSTGLVEALRELGQPRRIGVVGLGDVMKVDDYRALSAAFPGAELVDSGPAFERVRAARHPRSSRASARRRASRRRGRSRGCSKPPARGSRSAQSARRLPVRRSLRAARTCSS